MKSRSALLKEIQAEDFALYEAQLYLDTHPDSARALSYYHQRRCAVEALREEYEAAYGPLSASSEANRSCWRWIEGPWPWEKEAN